MSLRNPRFTYLETLQSSLEESVEEQMTVCFVVGEYQL
jgi:hypothetical protein